MKKYVIKANVVDRDIHYHQSSLLDDYLNNPPNGYEVDNYFVIPEDDSFHRSVTVVYKLIGTQINTANGRKFKQENE